ncbi:GDSL esterase/lipase 5 isoform X2 [Prosopis cineraria]|uniref:GDSL esterase/lipase 5 isoform X2 n=1 Tax=Prosopis cineraria TaxID=364024 RepID=UPI00240F8DC5|nr:GDSL esterase/lipase 5 isoform X2 [Prosopis cineraria]
MKKLEARVVFFVLFFLPGLFASGSHGSKQSHHRTAFFIFGDSLLDAGNNNYINTTTLDQANFWPYGETYFNFPTGRFSDGRLISDFIAEYANLPLIAPFLQPGNRDYYNGVNFASAGAGALVQTFQGSVISLRTQAKYFEKVERRLRKELGRREGKQVMSRAVYLFSIGNNDYLSPFLTSPDFLNSFSPSHYVSMVIGNFTSVVEDIYRRGGRKFGVINCLPLGCLPGTRLLMLNSNAAANASECFHQLSRLAILHNRALSLALSQLSQQLRGFQYSLYDFHTDLTHRIHHPSKFVGLSFLQDAPQTQHMVLAPSFD